MKVEITYFKTNGKFYADVEYETNKENLWEIWAEIHLMQQEGNLPGLIKGCGKTLMIHIDVPGHPHQHPHIIREIKQEQDTTETPFDRY